jgi:molybdenum cofactor cytidylyltransferase
MTDAADVALVMLAAGLSRRFGPADKLMAPLAGKPLIRHSIDRLAGFRFGERIAVIRNDAPDVAGLLSAAGYRLVVNPAPERGRGSSLALGAAAIGHADACLVWLADMPAVPAAHVRALLDSEAASVVASVAAGVKQPPALFRRAHFAALMASVDDSGPRALMQAATAIPVSARHLRDVDRAADLATADKERP